MESYFFKQTVEKDITLITNKYDINQMNLECD